MIVEELTYTLYPGKAAEFARLFIEHDLELATSVLGDPVGWYVTEIGPLNQVVQMWAYPSFEQRQARREALFAHPEWAAHRERLAPLVLRQDSKLLVPPPFFKALIERGLRFDPPSIASVEQTQKDS